MHLVYVCVCISPGLENSCVIIWRRRSSAAGARLSLFQTKRPGIKTTRSKLDAGVYPGGRKHFFLLFNIQQEPLSTPLRFSLQICMHARSALSFPAFARHMWAWIY